MKKPLPTRESLEVVIHKLKAMPSESAIPAPTGMSNQATEIIPEVLKRTLRESFKGIK